MQNDRTNLNRLADDGCPHAPSGDTTVYDLTAP